MILARRLRRPRCGIPIITSSTLQLGAPFKDLLHQGHHRLAAVEAETLRAGVFPVEILLENFGLGETFEDSATPEIREVRPVAIPSIRS